MTSFLKITSVGEVETAKNGRKFMKVYFKGESFLPNGIRITSNQKSVLRIVWDAFTDESGNKFQADPLFLELSSGQTKVGDGVTGSVQTVNTSEYKIGENKVSTYTSVIFSNENLITVCNRALKANHACVVVGDTLSAPENLAGSEFSKIETVKQD